MTRSIFLTTVLILVQIVCSKNLNANLVSRYEGLTINITSTIPVQEKQSMEVPVMGIKPNIHKIHLLKIEELGKVHRFHKERVKKNRHSNKYWIAAKILLICCHIALLIHAFMHLTH